MFFFKKSVRGLKRLFNYINENIKLWLIVIGLFLIVSSPKTTFAQTNEQDDDQDKYKGVHYIIGYDRSGTMIYESLKSSGRGNRLYPNYQRILTDVNNRVYEYLNDRLSANDRVTIALLGFTKSTYDQAVRNKYGNYFFEDLGINSFVVPYDDLYVSAEEVRTVLNEINTNMGDVDFRRNFTYPSLHKTALLKLTGQRHNGIHTQLILITDGKVNMGEGKYKEEINALREKGLGDAVTTSMEIEDYYLFQNILYEEEKHISITYYDVIPKPSNTIVSLLNVNDGSQFKIPELAYSYFSSVEAVPVFLDIEEGGELKFVQGYIDYGRFSETFKNDSFSLGFDRYEDNPDFPDRFDMTVQLQFKDKYDIPYSTLKGPYQVVFENRKQLEGLVFFLGAILIIAVILSRKIPKKIHYYKIIAGKKHLPMQNIYVVNKESVNKAYFNSRELYTENICRIQFQDLPSRIDDFPGKIVTLDVTISGTHEKQGREDDADFLFFKNVEDEYITNKTLELNSNQKDYDIEFYAKLYCEEPVEVTVKLEIKVPESQLDIYFDPEVKSYSDTFILTPPQDDYHEIWEWEWEPAGKEVAMTKGSIEIYLGRINFTTSQGEEKISSKRAGDMIRNNQLEIYATASEHKKWLVANQNIIFEEGVIYAKSPEKDENVPNPGIYTQIYIDPQKINRKITKITTIFFSVTAILKTGDNKVFLKKSGIEWEVEDFILVPDYGDKYFAVDFGTTASCILFGNLRDSIVLGETAQLENDKEKDRNLLDSFILIERDEILFKPIPKILLGKEAKDKYQRNPELRNYGFDSFKNVIGLSSLVVDDREYKVEYILTGIFQELYRRLCIYNSDSFSAEEVNRICISVPNAFLPGMIQTLKLCWLNVRRYSNRDCTEFSEETVFEDYNVFVIREAEAVASYYMFGKGNNIISDRKKQILVYDLGGGSLDVALVNVSQENYKYRLDILERLGYPLGGNYLDYYFGMILFNLYEDRFLFSGLDKNVLFSSKSNEKHDLRMLMKKCAREGKEKYSDKSKELIKYFSDIDIEPVILTKFLDDENYNHMPIKPAEQEQLRRYVRKYIEKVVNEPLKDLFSGKDDMCVEKVICSGRGIRYRGLNDEINRQMLLNGMVIDNADDFLEVLDGEENEAKFCVAKGALQYVVRREEIDLSNDKVYGTYFCIRDYDKDLFFRMFEENPSQHVWEEGSNFILTKILEAGTEYRQEHYLSQNLPDKPLGIASGSTEYAKLEDGKCIVYYGHGCNLYEDFKINRIIDTEERSVKYTEAAIIRNTHNTKDNLHSLVVNVYQNDDWDVEFDGRIIDKDITSQKELRLVPLDSNSEVGKKIILWPYSTKDFTNVK